MNRTNFCLVHYQKENIHYHQIPFKSKGILNIFIRLSFFEKFSLLDCDEAMKLIRKTNRTYCLNDPLDVRLLNFEEVDESLASCFCMVKNSSLDSGYFPTSEKFAIIR